MMSRDRKCCVPKCGRTSQNNREIKFYAIPKDPELEPKWMENIKIKKLFNKVNYVCSIHFEDEAQSEKRLKKNAVPTLHLGYNGLVPHKYIKHYVVKRKCCIESCKLQHTCKDLKTYKFPDSNAERLDWARACNLPLPLPDKEIYICERHFERRYISRMRLRCGAFPKYFLNGEDDENVEESPSDEEQSDERRKPPGMPVKVRYSRAIEKGDSGNISTEESEILELPTHQEQIQRLNIQIEDYDDFVTHKYTNHGTVQRKCCIESCKMEDTRKYIKTYKFPDSKNERLDWARAFNLPLPLPNKELYICERHFERKCLSRNRLLSRASPKIFLSSEDIEENDGSRQAPSLELNEVLPVKLTYSGDIKNYESDINSTEESEYLELSLHEEQIQNLNIQIENLKKRVIFLKNSAIYPQPGASDESVTLARMIVGAKKTEYTEKEKALAKKLRSNMFSNDYDFLKQELGFRLPLIKAVKRNRSK